MGIKMGVHEADSPKPLKIGKILQIGVVVKNLEDAVEYYSKHFGLGPWRTRVAEHLPYAVVRGIKTPYTCKLAFTEIPPLQLELIEVTEGPSIQLDHLESKGEGIHHLQYRVDNLEEEIVNYEAHGFKVLQEMRGKEGGFAYMSSDRVGGIIFEIVGPSPSLKPS
jgi:methylmalonyl-CoA/ethylmalonyl-CoA epimerase